MPNIILERAEDGTTECVAIRMTDNSVSEFLDESIGDYLIYDEDGTDVTANFTDSVMDAPIGQIESGDSEED